MVPDGYDFVIEGDGGFFLSVPQMGAVLKDKASCEEDRGALKECEGRECEKVDATSSVLTSPLFWGVVGGLVAASTAVVIGTYELTKPDRP